MEKLELEEMEDYDLLTHQWVVGTTKEKHHDIKFFIDATEASDYYEELLEVTNDGAGQWVTVFMAEVTDVKEMYTYKN